VAKAVVNLFDVVEIDTEHGETATCDLRSIYGAPQVLVKGGPVWQFSERVVTSEIIDLLLRPVPIRHIESDADVGGPRLIDERPRFDCHLDGLAARCPVQFAVAFSPLLLLTVLKLLF